MKTLIFDTETSDLFNKELPDSHPLQPHIVQLGLLLVDKEFQDIAHFCALVKPNGWSISAGAEERHGIKLSQCEDNGLSIEYVLDSFDNFFALADCLAGHSFDFDLRMINAERIRMGKSVLGLKPSYCTMKLTTDICRLPSKIPGKFKWPKLQEAYEFLFGEQFDKAHDAMADVRASCRILQYLREKELVEA